MKNKRLIQVLLLFMIVSLAVSWHFIARGRRVKAICSGPIHNVLLISIDTCRSDHLSCYGYPQKTTPNIDQLAEEGFLFENVISPVPITLPAHSSMLTGTNPIYHGVRDNFAYQLAKSETTLAEKLRKKGFATGAVISAYVLDSKFGLAQGFDSYNDRFEEEKILSVTNNERKGHEATGIAVKWIEEHKDDPFFFFLHYYDPHSDYTPPEPFATKFASDPYAGEIAYTDHCIGQVVGKLKDLDLYDSTLIIIVGDHGEMLGEHGEQYHSYYIYQSAIKVPLIFKVPGKHKPKRMKELAGIIDIVPTIYSLLGMKTPAVVHGKDLSNSLAGKEEAGSERALYCESLFPTKYNANSLLGVVTDHYKYIQTTRPELYDLLNDPLEAKNLIDQEPQRGRILQDCLKQILEGQLRENNGSFLKADSHTVRRLESLGYVSGSVSEDIEFDQNKKDPKDLLSVHLAVLELSDIINGKKKGDVVKSKALCDKILAEMPDCEVAYHHLANIYMKQKDYAGAVRNLLKANELDPDNHEVHKMMGFAYARLGEFEKAETYLRKTLRTNPDDPVIMLHLGLVLLEQNKIEESKKYYLKALKFRPEMAGIYYRLGMISAIEGKTNIAIDHYNKALQLQPDFPDVLNAMAWCKSVYPNADFYDPDEAIKLSIRANGLTGNKRPRFLHTLSVAYAAAERFPEAIEAVEKAIQAAILAGQNELAEAMKKCLELYKAGKPYYEIL